MNGFGAWTLDLGKSEFESLLLTNDVTLSSIFSLWALEVMFVKVYKP